MAFIQYKVQILNKAVQMVMFTLQQPRQPIRFQFTKVSESVKFDQLLWVA